MLNTFYNYTSTRRFGDSMYICFQCEKDVKSIFDFKILSMNNEHYLGYFKSHQSQNKINLVEMLQKKAVDEAGYCIADLSEICRICLKQTSFETASHLNMVTEMLDTCFPEMDLALTTKTLFCEVCTTALEKQYKFLIQHSMKKEKEDFEEIILNNAYVKKEVCDSNKLQKTKLPETIPLVSESNDCDIKKESDGLCIASNSQDNIECIKSIQCEIILKLPENDSDQLPKHIKQENEVPSEICGMINSESCNSKCNKERSFRENMPNTLTNKNSSKDERTDQNKKLSTCWRTCYYCSYSTTLSLKNHLKNHHPTRESEWRTLLIEENSSHKGDTFQFEMAPVYQSVQTNWLRQNGSTEILEKELEHKDEFKGEDDENISQLNILHNDLKSSFDVSQTVGDFIVDLSHLVKADDSIRNTEWNNCPYCPYSTQLPLTPHISNAHPDKIFFKCFRCTFQTGCKKDFGNHVLKCHSQPYRCKKKDERQKQVEIPLQVVECPDCSEKLDKTTYKQHMESHYTPEDTWPQCPICPYRAFSFNSLKSHILKSNHGDKNLIEQILEETLKKMSEKDRGTEKIKLSAVKSNVKYAKKKSNKRKRQIDIDRKESLSKKSIGSKEEEKPEYFWPQCPFCPVRLVNEDSLNRHIRNKHPSSEQEETWPKCPKCPYRTDIEASLKAHIWTCHKGPAPRPAPKYHCKMCTFSTSRKRAIAQHTRYTHGDYTVEESWPKCTECPYRTKLPASLKTHMVNTHKKRTEIK